MLETLTLLNTVLLVFIAWWVHRLHQTMMEEINEKIEKESD
jgi:hypothetical protein